MSGFPACWPAYSRSKLANILFTRALARRLAGTGVTANCLHPGLVHSHLFHDGPALLRGVLGVLGRTFMLSPQQGARTSIYLASVPRGRRRQRRATTIAAGASPRARAAQNDADAERLWQASARLTGSGIERERGGGPRRPRAAAAGSRGSAGRWASSQGAAAELVSNDA